MFVIRGIVQLNYEEKLYNYMSTYILCTFYNIYALYYIEYNINIFDSISL